MEIDQPDSAAQDQAFVQLRDWYESYRSSKGVPPERFVICAGLMVLEKLRDKRVVQRTDLVTPSNRARTNANFIQGILKRFGEDRILSKEGGRTTSSTVSAADALFPQLNAIDELADMADGERSQIIDLLQKWLAARATEYLDQKKIEVEINTSKPTSFIVKGILDAAGAKAGAVAQHLVGAKLEVRLNGTGIQVENHGYTTADEMLKRPGDFLVNDAVFHVTMSPMQPVVDKCRNNLTAGYKPYLLVPDVYVDVARGLARMGDAEANISIITIEQFVGQNMDEMSSFSRQQVGSMFRHLLETYNERVKQVETDPSLQIEIPENLI